MPTDKPSLTDNSEIWTNNDGVDSTISTSSNSDTTEPTKNGQRKLLTAKVKVAEFADELNQYMVEKGIPDVLPRHIDHYLNMTRSEFATLSTEDLDEIQFELTTHAYYVQTVYNKQIAKAEHCHQLIDEIIGPRLGNYTGYYGKEERRLIAIADDSHATELRKLEVKGQCAASAMAFLSQRIEQVATCLENMAKRRQYAKK